MNAWLILHFLWIIYYIKVLEYKIYKDCEKKLFDHLYYVTVCKLRYNVMQYQRHTVFQSRRRMKGADLLLD